MVNFFFGGNKMSKGPFSPDEDDELLQKILSINSIDNASLIGKELIQDDQLLLNNISYDEQLSYLEAFLDKIKELSLNAYTEKDFEWRELLSKIELKYHTLYGAL